MTLSGSTRERLSQVNLSDGTHRALFGALRFPVKQTLIAIALVAGCTSVAQAAPITFQANLSGLFENPANASPGTGFVTVTIDTVSHTLFVEATFSGLLGTTMAAHIHCCAAPPANAGVATMTPSFSGFPLGVTSGSFSNSYDMTLASSWNSAFILNNGGTPASAEAVLMAGLLAGNAYFNIHTSTFPGGEIRGNLVAAPAPVPEPGTFGMLGVGLAALWAARRRLRR